MGNAAATRAGTRVRLAGIVGDPWVTDWDEPAGPLPERPASVAPGPAGQRRRGPADRRPGQRDRHPARPDQLRRDRTGTAARRRSWTGRSSVDLRRMNRILRIDRRHRLVLIEPGVTFERAGSRPSPSRASGSRCRSSRARASPSSPSLLEREPPAVPRLPGTPSSRCGPSRSSGATGAALHRQRPLPGRDATPTGRTARCPLVAGGPGQIDFFRLHRRRAGRDGDRHVGVGQAASRPPRSRRSLVLAADRLDDLVAVRVRSCSRIRFGDETVHRQRRRWPCWLGRARGRADARARAAALDASSSGSGVVPSSPHRRRPGGRPTSARSPPPTASPSATELAGLDRRELLARLQAPVARAVPGATGPAAAPGEIFFLTTLDRAQALRRRRRGRLRGRRTCGIGVYLQPIHQGAGLHCELILPFDRPCARCRRSRACAELERRRARRLRARRLLQPALRRLGRLGLQRPTPRRRP